MHNCTETCPQEHSKASAIEHTKSKINIKKALLLYVSTQEKGCSCGEKERKRVCSQILAQREKKEQAQIQLNRCTY